MKLSELFIPKWKHPDKQIRVAAVKKLTDQGKLEQVVQNETDGNIRIEALIKVTNQTLLADVAQHDPDDHIRYLAVRSLHDQQVLYGLVEKDKSDKVREAAFQNIKDEKIRQELAQSDSKLKTLHQKYCIHKYVETWSELDMTDMTTVYTLNCTKCGRQVKTSNPNQYK